MWHGILVNRYDGVLERGWIESGGHYPNDHDIRTDLTNSLRSKDAENVFYRWTTIFEQTDPFYNTEGFHNAWEAFCGRGAIGVQLQ
ncbi:MAG: hypothetical protein V1755_07290 [Chloroflexota bacterium]